MKHLLTLFLVTTICSSCFRHYFHVSSNEKWNYAQLASFKQRGKTFIIHNLNETHKMTNPQFESNTISGKLEAYFPLSYNDNSEPYADIEPTIKPVPYRIDHKKYVLSEVHIYVSEARSVGDSLTITKDNFLKVREYKHAQAATSSSHTIGVVGIAAAGVAGFYLLIAVPLGAMFGGF